MWTDLDPLDLVAAPAESIESWMRAVRNMDRDALDAFVRRTWRAWNPGSLRPVALAVDERRAQLDGD